MQNNLKILLAFSALLISYCEAKDRICLGDSVLKNALPFECVSSAAVWQQTNETTAVKGVFSVLAVVKFSKEFYPATGYIMVGFGDLNERPVLIGIPKSEQVAVKKLSSHENTDIYSVGFISDNVNKQLEIAVNKNGEVSLNHEVVGVIAEI